MIIIKAFLEQSIPTTTSNNNVKQWYYGAIDIISDSDRNNEEYVKGRVFDGVNHNGIAGED